MNNFRFFWKNQISEMIADEKEGEDKYRDIAETFDEMADDEAKHAQKLEEVGKMGVEGAGPVPESGLAGQDLEGETRKSADSTKKLENIADKAEDVTTEKQADALVNKLKSIQEQRQNAQLRARGATRKSFKADYPSIFSKK